MALNVLKKKQLKQKIGLEQQQKNKTNIENMVLSIGLEQLQKSI